MKVFDCFLFFNELDLLEIRLTLLYPYVDFFVIVEAEVTFQGKNKGFNFEKNQNRYEKFKDKIIYFKISEYICDFNNLPIKEHPKQDDEFITNKIFNLLEKTIEFNKNHYWWGNECFQRESIWRALSLYNPSDTDLILLSDADEIISVTALNEIKSRISPNIVFNCTQHEFYYFLNYYHNSNWFGTCAFLYGTYKYQSLNNLRAYRNQVDESIKKINIVSAGWHFTSLGDISTIETKITSWGHKEFNNKFILQALKYNISHGYDIFRRKNFGKLTNLNLKNKLLKPIFETNFYNYHHLIGPEIQKENWFNRIAYSIYFKVFRRFY
jgi:beta-1,4-mannosyl-glycoprotein beta-1,4-N-acetylglucosaminyltransferase